jgi:hypothetical protein
VLPSAVVAGSSLRVGTFVNCRRQGTAKKKEMIEMCSELKKDGEDTCTEKVAFVSTAIEHAGGNGGRRNNGGRRKGLGGPSAKFGETNVPTSIVGQEQNDLFAAAPPKYLHAPTPTAARALNELKKASACTALESTASRSTTLCGGRRVVKKKKTKVYRSTTTRRSRSKPTTSTVLKDKRTPAEKKKAATRLAAKTRVKDNTVVKTRTKNGKLSQQFRSKSDLNSKSERSKSSSTTNTRKGKQTFRSASVTQNKETGEQFATRNRTNKRGRTRTTFVTGPKAFKKYSKWEKKDNKKAARQAKRGKLK